MKATIEDIAAKCALSTATVDRVLNNRPGVSAANRQRVMDAALQLGYLPTAGAVAMPSRPAELEFLIPIGTNSFMADLATQIEDYCARLPLVSKCTINRLSGITPRALEESIERLSPGVQGIGVIIVDHPKTRNMLRDLVEGGVKLVTIASDVAATPRAAYVGVDNRIAGRTAAYLMGRFLSARSGNLAVVVGSRAYSGHVEREMGFRTVITEDFANLAVSDVLEINDEPEASYAAMRKLLARSPDILGIYCAGAGRSGIVRAVEEARLPTRPIFICHDLTREMRSYLLDDIADVVIDQNARLIAEQSVIQLLGSIATSPPYLTKKLVEPRIVFKENIPAW